jgi:PRC-barrel domain protein
MDSRARCNKRTRTAAAGLALVATSLAMPANATTSVAVGGRFVVLAQAMVPRTGMMDAQQPMPMKERYLKRFPQPARVGDLIGMPVLDLNSKTLGYVQQVVLTPAGEIEFIVGYSRWWGWFGRPVAVPLEALGIEGGQLVSLDMQPSEYDTAPTWHDTGATPLSADATVRVALSRS